MHHYCGAMAEGCATVVMTLMQTGAGCEPLVELLEPTVSAGTCLSP